MTKKTLLCGIIGVILSLTLIFPVHAAPDNSISSNLIIENFEYDGFVESLDISVPFGKVHYIQLDWIGDYPPTTDRYITGSFSLTTNEYFDIFIAVNADNSNYSVSTPFSDYLSKSDSFSDEFRPSSGTLLTWDSDDDSLSISSITSSFTKEVMYFTAYKSVPGGSYDLDWEAIYTESNPEDSDFYIGVFAVPGVAPSPDDPTPDWSNDPVGGFENGYYSFEEAVNKLTENMDNLISQTTIPEVKQFYVLYYSYQLELLEKQSDIIYNAAVSDFNDSGEQIVNEYESSDDVDPTEYINRLQMLFTDALSQATSPEQGSFLSSVFQNLLAKLQLAFDVSYKAELDNTISDSQLETDKGKQNNLLSKYFEEDELRKKFSQAEFDALSDWRTWLDDIGDYTSYRSIFNYIFTEFGIISTIVQIPFTFMIVALLLGTAINRSSTHHSRKEVEKNSEIRTVDE